MSYPPAGTRSRACLASRARRGPVTRISAEHQARMLSAADEPIVVRARGRPVLAATACQDCRFGGGGPPAGGRVVQKRQMQPQEEGSG
jgi:hypothetical protein